VALEHDIRLMLGATGTSCDVFDEYRAVVDMTQVGNPWLFTLWKSDDAQSAWDVLTGATTPVRAGDWVGLTIDSALQLVGQVRRREIDNAGREGVKLVIAGGDLLAPAVKAHVDPRAHLDENTVLPDAITGLLGPLGIDVTVGVAAQTARAVAQGARRGAHGAADDARPRRPRVGRVHARDDDTAWGLVETYCRQVGLMAWIAPLAERRVGIVLDVPDYAQAPTYQFVLRTDGGQAPDGAQIETSNYVVDTDDVPTNVFVRAHSARTDAQPARYLAQVANGGLFSDALAADLVSLQLPSLPRWLRSTRSHGPQAAQQDALRVIADANRRLRTYRCTVQGHGQFTRHGLRLFAVNTVARVRDDVCRIRDESFLIHRVEFHGSRRSGAMTTLEMHPLGAINLVPDPDA
jgi:hypothetical protein